MKKITLTLSLDGRHGITRLPWTGYEYPEIEGLEGIRLAAIRCPLWSEDKGCHVADSEDWKLTEVTTGGAFRDIGICLWPTMPKLIEKAVPVLRIYAEEIREKVKEYADQ